VINSNLGSISHRFRDTPLITENFSLKIAAKQLQIKTWLLLTAYRKTLASYPMVQLQTPYNLPFCHNTARLAYHSATTFQGHPSLMILM